MIIKHHGEMSVRYIIGDNDSKIINRLADEIEGTCGSEGFILPESCRMISRSAPFLNRNTNGGITNVIVKYECDMVILKTGDKISAKIIGKNRLGAMAEYYVNDTVVSKIILPSDIQERGADEYLKRDKLVDIEILDHRFGFGWDKITAVGRVIIAKKTTDEIDLITDEIDDHGW